MKARRTFRANRRTAAERGPEDGLDSPPLGRRGPAADAGAGPADEAVAGRRSRVHRRGGGRQCEAQASGVPWPTDRGKAMKQRWNVTVLCQAAESEGPE